MTSEEKPITMSRLCQEITREGQTIDVLIYDDGAAGWLLEVVDVHGTSLVWDDSFATDQEALDEVFAALDDECMQGFFAGDHGDSTLAVNEDRALLEAFLSEQNNSAALTYFQTCGFLFAVSCCPQLIPPSEWMPMITLEQKRSAGMSSAPAEVGRNIRSVVSEKTTCRSDSHFSRADGTKRSSK